MPIPVRRPLLSVPAHSGFSLLELAVVTVIIAAVAGSGMVVGKATLDSAQVATTQMRLNTIETALLAFRRANDRIPCPADASLAPASAQYGREAANPGTCMGGTPAANFDASAGGSSIVEGALPVKALSLPDEFMYDGWGRKFAYAVWAPATGTRGFINYGISSNCGMQSIRNAVGMARSNNGVYTLVSFGPNGHGAYNEMGQRVGVQSVNADEHINCHCNMLAADTGYLGTYVQKDGTQNPANTLDVFDDIVRYKERWQLQNYYDEYNPGGYLVCPSTGPGLRSYGLASGDTVGVAEAVGDINGDGVQDLMVGIPRQLAGGSAGSVAVIFGKVNGLANPLPLSGLNGENGFMINSAEANDWAGTSLAVGDMNNDNVVDLAIGAPRAGADNGKLYVVYGHVAPWSATLNLGALTAAEGFAVTNDVSAAGLFGRSVAFGDMTRDKLLDLVVGAPGAGAGNGAVYVIRGRNTAFAAANSLSAVVTSTIPGNTGSAAGSSVAAGDVNGDRISDLVIGQPGDGVTMPGSVAVRFGKRLGWTNGYFDALWGYNGYELRGEAAGDRFGHAVAIADIDGNRISDIIVGAPGYLADNGAAYVYFGHGGRKIRYNDAAWFNGLNGTRLPGVAAGDLAGSAVTGVDLNGDGFGDVVVGAPGASPGGLSGAGTTYIVFGQAGWGSSFALSALNGTNGFKLNGSTAGDGAGSSFAIGDLDRDFSADLVLGAPQADYAFTNAGAVYLYYGERKEPPWTLNIDLNSL